MMGMAAGRQLIGIALALAAMLTYPALVVRVTVASKRLDSNTDTLLATMANLASGVVLLALQ